MKMACDQGVQEIEEEQKTEEKIEEKKESVTMSSKWYKRKCPSLKWMRMMPKAVISRR